MTAATWSLPHEGIQKTSQRRQGVTVDSEPQGARIVNDGSVVGTTPAMLELGYESQRRSVRLKHCWVMLPLGTVDLAIGALGSWASYRELYQAGHHELGWVGMGFAGLYGLTGIAAGVVAVSTDCLLEGPNNPGPRPHTVERDYALRLSIDKWEETLRVRVPSHDNRAMAFFRGLEQSDWRRTEALHTVQAYRSHCHNYPSSEHCTTGAQSHIELAWQPARVPTTQPVVEPSMPSTHPNQAPRMLFSTRGLNYQQEGRIPGRRNLSRDEKKKLFRQAFGRYLSDSRFCKTTQSRLSLAEARQKSQFAPSVAGAYEGSFTQAGERELLVVVSMRECDATHMEKFGTTRALILSGDRIVLNAELVDFWLLAIQDVDGDGRAEVVIVDGYMSQGYVEAKAVLVGFRDGAVVTLKKFGQVLDDSCVDAPADEEAPTGEAATRTDTTVSYLPSVDGQLPEFTIEPHVEDCQRSP